MLARAWRNWTLTLLVGIRNGDVTMKYHLAVLQKVKWSYLVRLSNPTPRCVCSEKLKACTRVSITTLFLTAIKQKQPKCSTDKSTNKMHLYNGILFGYWMNTDSFYNKKEPRRHCANERSQIKDYLVCESLSMKCQGRKTQQSTKDQGERTKWLTLRCRILLG